MLTAEAEITSAHVTAKTQPRKPKAVQADIERLLAQERDDRKLREALETLTTEPGFHGVPSYVWAPRLYQRNRVLFRPFILSHLAPFTSFRGWKHLEWKGEAARVLEPWLAEVDGHGDVALFRTLYTWKLGVNAAGWRRRGRQPEEVWRRDLLARLRAAATAHERREVLQRFDLGLRLDEATAVAIYALDPTLTPPFLLRHLPVSDWTGGTQRRRWRQLHEAAGRAGNADFAMDLYRRQVPVAEWREDVKRLCREIADAGRLVLELEKHHPHGFWVKGVGHGLYDALEARGREAFPYVRRHLRDVWRGTFGRESYHEILALALRQGWHDLHADAVRTCGTRTEVNDAVADILAAPISDQETVARLIGLAGVSRELNLGGLGLAQVHAFTDANAVVLYGRFPALLRGPFKAHVGARLWGEAHPDLIARVRAAGDTELLDYLASRALMHVDDKKHLAVAEALSADYEALLENPAEFARRAAAVLGQVPAFSMWHYPIVVRRNRLARLLYERAAESYLADAAAIRDMLEAPEIHVQALAFRALGSRDPRAAEIARANIDLLAATLLRPLHRRTRRLAFAALANAVSEPEAAGRVLERARQALDLPDAHYDKEALVGLLGLILHRWPERRGPKEHPEVRRETAEARG